MKEVMEHMSKAIQANMEIVAPITGGGVGFFSLMAQLAPLVSIIAATTGIVLGILSYRMKKSKYLAMEHKLKEHLKSGENGQRKKEEDWVPGEVE